MPERVIIFSGIMCDPEIGRTTAWIYVVLPKRLLGWHASESHPDRGNSSLIYPGISSLPGRFFLGLSEEVCPEALWLAESLSLKESKIYEFNSRQQLHVSIAKRICNLL